jgi:hypothetical protein
MGNRIAGLVFSLIIASSHLQGQVPTLPGNDKSNAEQRHPRILVNAGDKQQVLQKISRQPWAAKVYAEMKERIAPYVERHRRDPEWILSRYLMNRIPGKRYTEFVSDADGTKLIAYAGDAPYPTVRVAPHKRQPVSKDGYTYRQPTIEELTPYDTSMMMYMTVNSPDRRKEWADPQTFVDNINQKINELALDAAVIYWIDGDSSYARFAADILSQWARGAYHQEPIKGPCRTGFLSIQTLGDGSYEQMPLIYDFLYDFLRKNNYETKWYDPVFDKIARTMTFRGFWNNNWFAAQTPALVFSALALEDPARQAYYLNFVMNKDTINGSCGHLSMPSVVKEWLTPDGHWKEPGGYHNFPVSSLLISGVALEKNGYNVFQKYPALFQASYVMLKYSFPNLMASSFGDTGPASQTPQCLEIGLLMADKYKLDIYQDLASAMQVLRDEKGYKRDQADHLGLLCYLPEINPSPESPAYKWPSSGTLDFAKAFFQRNGTDRKNGLMFVVQGASYNHNHANGMSMELYGRGSVMGPDPGNGLTYEDPMHVGYYTQWGAHNTVIAGGSSTSVPAFTGGGGTKKIGEIKLKAMEPMPEADPVSASFSFVTTGYSDPVSGARQERTLTIIRTSPQTGYYLDIFRSAHPESNQYVYHNIGKELVLQDTKGSPIATDPSIVSLPLKQQDPTGLRFVKSIRGTGVYEGTVTGIFRMEDGISDTRNRYMKIMMPGQQKRSYFSGMAPPTKTVIPAYASLQTPTLIMEQSGEAWERPFVAVFEPYGTEGDNILNVTNLNAENRKKLTAVQIKNRDASEQIIFQSVDNKIIFQEKNWRFKGLFGAVNLMNGKPSELYLGSGTEISCGDFSIICNTADASASMKIMSDRIMVSAQKEVTVKIGKKSVKVAPSREFTIRL